jgi:hypothetical protein
MAKGKIKITLSEKDAIKAFLQTPPEKKKQPKKKAGK